MKIIITDQLTHKSNKDYQGVLIQFSDVDKHFFPDKKNWMPKSSEAFAIHKLMYALDTKYRGLIIKDQELVLKLINTNQEAIKLLSKEFKDFVGFMSK